MNNFRRGKKRCWPGRPDMHWNNLAAPIVSYPRGFRSTSPEHEADRKKAIMRTVHDKTGEHIEVTETEAKQGQRGRHVAIILGVSLAAVWVILSLVWVVFSQQQ